VADINEQGGQNTVRLIKEAGGEAIFVKVDVSDNSSIELMVRTAVETYGRIDCVHNNAAYFKMGKSIDETSEEVFDRMIAVNLQGGRGVIINTSSTAGLKGVPYMGAYAASKFGVIGLTKTAAIECANKGIRVNAVCPGVVNTPLMAAETLTQVSEKYMLAGQPMKRKGEPVEIAAAVVWLCSDEASYATGMVMCVDGGASAM